MAKRIGLLTAGGDAPGLNVCLKAIVYNACDRGFEVVGIRKGWEGLLHYNPDNPTTHGENAMLLTKHRVRDIDRMGGSFLHSSRLSPAEVPARATPDFLGMRRQGDEPVDLTDHIKRVIGKLGLEALVVLGDRGALGYAARLSGEGIPLVAIPKTVHNDVFGTDYALGFSTALGRGVNFVHEIRAMAGSREEIGVVEVFGRTSGYTTLAIAYLAGADRALIPEAPFDPEQLAALLLRDKRSNPNNYAILVMSEATSVVAGKATQYATLFPHLQALMRDAGDPAEPLRLAGTRGTGHEVSGSGDEVTEILEHLTEQRLVYQSLSYLIRTGAPDGQDLLGAMNFAMLAMNLVADRQTGRLVAYRRRENYCDVPIDVVTQGTRELEISQLYDAANYVTRPGILWAASV